ncbi:MAG TPA: efflux RND transporter periplasmic adaptor subunit [Gemmatimonadaceae bacterium]
MTAVLPFILVIAGVATGCGSGKAPPPDTTQLTAAGATTGDSPAHDAVVLDTARLRLGGIRVGLPESAASSNLPVTGTITYDANRVTQVGARTEGRVIAIRVDLGSRVRQGQVLVELESPTIGQIRAEEHEARALVKIARENYDRERRLESQGISSRKELLTAEAELRRAEASLRSADDRLSTMGAGHGTGGHFDVLAPFPGMVVARNVSLGAMAGPSDALLTIADLSRLWIELDVFERDLSRVAVGQPVSVTTTAYPDRTFPGRIVYLGQVLDPAKRTVRARVDIPNADGALKPGMFATANIRVGGGGVPLVVVPQAAVQEVDGRQVVFVPGVRPGEFRPQPVEVGESLEGDRVVIRSGLTPSSRVVLAGAFALRSELAKGEIGDEGH